MAGQIAADGGQSGFPGELYGGYGSGGAIRIVANSITVSGSLTACGRSCDGVIRLEAPSGRVLVTSPNIRPAAIVSEINPILVANGPIPNLQVVSVGGFPVSTYSGSRHGLVDVLLPSTLPDPIPIVLRGSNIPPGTRVQARVVGSPDATTSGGILQGSLESSQTTINVAHVDRSAVTHFFFYATFEPATPLAVLAGGREQQVAKVRIETHLAGGTQVAYLRADGSPVR